MDCLHTAAPDDEELLKFILDEIPLSKEVQAHLAECETCQQRLAAYKQINDFLLSQLYRSQCPSSTQLSLYCANYLPADECIEIATHLQLCPLCTAEVTETRRFLAASEPLPAPSPSLVNTARRLVATLMPPKMELVLRSEAPRHAWPLQYRAGNIDLLLNRSRINHKAYMLLGAITNTDAAEDMTAFEGSKAELYLVSNSDHSLNGEQANRPFITTWVDDLGSFIFNAVPPGTYTLIVHLPQRELIVEELIIETT